MTNDECIHGDQQPEELLHSDASWAAENVHVVWPAAKDLDLCLAGRDELGETCSPAESDEDHLLFLSAEHFAQMTGEIHGVNLSHSSCLPIITLLRLNSLASCFRSYESRPGVNS